MTSLRGARVALLEARLGTELADLIRRYGGDPHGVPAVREAPIDGAGQTAALIDGLEDGDCSVVVFQTGAGVTALFAEAARIGRADALRAALTAATTVSRGPKPAAALRRESIPVRLNVRSPYTTAELLESLAQIDLHGVGTAIVHYGEINRPLTEAVAARGAAVWDLCLYEWLLPDDLRPLERLIDDLIAGRHDVIAFTSQVQARHLMQVAARIGRAAGLIDALNQRLVVASIGPTCTAGLAALGIAADVEPDSPKMAPLVRRLVEHLAERGRDDSGPAPPASRVERRQFLRFLGLGSALIASPAFLAACGGGAALPSAATAPPVKAPATTGGSTPAGAAAPASSPAAVKTGTGEKIKLGFIALTDCASVVMAHELGLYKKYGLDVDVVKQASWAGTRDNLLSGEIQGAHCLFGMPFSVYTGVGGTAGKELPIALILNDNGQAITLSQAGFGGKVAYGDVKQIKAAVDALRATKEPTFAMTFPGGTHDIWLRYWLAAGGVDQKTVKIITVPPPQMVANMKVGNMDGFCVGEPWGGVAVKEGIGFTQIATQDIWTNHPEKALVVNPDFATRRREDLKLVMRAVLEASAFIDDPKNKPQVAQTIGDAAYVNASADVIDARLQGSYDLGGGLGQREFKADTMLFSNGGLVNAPRRSYGAWFLTQYVRFGLLSELPDVQAVTKKLILTDLYAEVAKDLAIPIPDDDWAPFTVKLDGATFDPADPAGYLKTHGGKA